MPSLRRGHRAAPRLSPVRSTARTPAPASRATSGRRVRLHRVAEGDEAQARGRARAHEPRHGAGPRAASRSPRPRRAPARPSASAPRPALARDGQRRSLDLRLDAAARHGADTRRRRTASMPRARGRVDHRPRERMLARRAAPRQRARSTSRPRRLAPRRSRVTGGLPCGERAGLVEDHDRALRCAISSASASLMRMPWRAATPVPAMIAVGVARPERARAGDHEHRHRVEDGAPPSRPRRSPHAEERRRARPPRSPARTPSLTRSTRRWIGAFARLGRLDAADDARERRLGSHARWCARRSGPRRSPSRR